MAEITIYDNPEGLILQARYLLGGEQETEEFWLDELLLDYLNEYLHQVLSPDISDRAVSFHTALVVSSTPPAWSEYSLALPGMQSLQQVYWNDGKLYSTSESLIRAKGGNPNGRGAGSTQRSSDIGTPSRYWTDFSCSDPSTGDPTVAIHVYPLPQVSGILDVYGDGQPVACEFGEPLRFPKHFVMAAIHYIAHCMMRDREDYDPASAENQRVKAMGFHVDGLRKYNTIVKDRSVVQRIRMRIAK